jgi:hypothetical protein
VTKQSHEIATLRPEHHAVQGFARNDSSIHVHLFMTITIVISYLEISEKAEKSVSSGTKGILFLWVDKSMQLFL